MGSRRRTEFTLCYPHMGKTFALFFAKEDFGKTFSCLKLPHREMNVRDGPQTQMTPDLSSQTGSFGDSCTLKLHVFGNWKWLRTQELFPGRNHLEIIGILGDFFSSRWRTHLSTHPSSLLMRPALLACPTSPSCVYVCVCGVCASVPCLPTCWVWKGTNYLFCTHLKNSRGFFYRWFGDIRGVIKL